METNIKEINSYTRQLDITIAWDQIQSEFEKEFMIEIYIKIQEE